MKTRILIAVVLGFGMGLVCHSISMPTFILSSLDMIGQLFLRLLKMVSIPLIVASLIVGITHLKTEEKLKAMGLTTFLYYFATTAIAVVIGLILVNLFQPGTGVEVARQGVSSSHLFDRSGWGEMFLSFIPENIFSALAQMQFVPIIFFSIIFGLVLNVIGAKAKPICDFFEALNQVMLTLVDWIMKLAPYGVFALLSTVVAQMGFAVFAVLGKYVGVVLIGLLLHGCLILPLILSWWAKRKPLAYVKAMSPALSTAFSTSSSAATLPVTIECAEKEAKISKETAGFVLPLGATINMDGTALYESVAAVFIAQVYGISLTFGDQIIIFLTATLASIGAAAIPSAGLVTMAIVLKAVGLPLEGIALIVGVDRLLDMCRTTVNVWGDSVGAAVVDFRMKN